MNGNLLELPQRSLLLIEAAPARTASAAVTTDRGGPTHIQIPANTKQNQLFAQAPTAKREGRTSFVETEEFSNELAEVDARVGDVVERELRSEEHTSELQSQ